MKVRTDVPNQQAVISLPPAQEGRKYSRSIPSIAAKVLPLATLLFALSNIPSADAGPVAYAACCTACTLPGLAGAPISLAAIGECVKACLSMLFAPSP